MQTATEPGGVFYTLNLENSSVRRTIPQKNILLLPPKDRHLPRACFKLYIEGGWAANQDTNPHLANREIKGSQLTQDFLGWLPHHMPTSVSRQLPSLRWRENRPLQGKKIWGAQLLCHEAHTGRSAAEISLFLMPMCFKQFCLKKKLSKQSRTPKLSCKAEDAWPRPSYCRMTLLFQNTQVYFCNCTEH